LSPRFPFIRFDDDRGPNKSALDTTRRRHINELLRNESKAQKRILKAWKGAEKRILRDLARLLKSMEAAESLGIPLSPSFIYREARLQEFLTTVRQETAALGDVAVDATAAAQEAMGNAGLQHALQRLEAYLPDQSFIRLPKEAVNHLVGNLADGSPLSELLGTLPGAAVGQVEQVLIDGLATARNPREIVRAIRKVAVDTPRDRAVLISRTEINRAYRSSLIESYKANDHVCSGWVWRSARDRRTCPVCLAMDGQRFKWDDPFGSHPACRCTPDPVLKYLDDPISESDTGEAWLRRQPEDRQLQALGPTRHKAWREGRPLAEMVKVVPNDRWGPGRRMRPLNELGLTRLPRPPRQAPPAPPAPPVPRLRPKAKPKPPKPAPQPAGPYSRLSPDASYRAQQLFGAPVKVNATPAGRQALKDVLGFEPEDDQLADLVGALGGSTVTVTGFNTNIVEVRVSHSLINNQRRTIRRNAAGNVFIHNEELVLSPGARGAGIGPMTFQKQVDGAARSGIDWIETWGAKLRGFPDGYRVWPNLGYNQVLPPESVKKLPKKFSAAVTVQDLIALPGGREWWAKKGTNLRDLKFDLMPGSLSRQILDDVMKKHQVKFADRRRVEDPGVQGLRDGEVALSDAEHSATVKNWLKVNDPEKFKKLFPQG
jgi:SPP1 gp7 family putative phage head morphogenesis protein